MKIFNWRLRENLISENRIFSWFKFSFFFFFLRKRIKTSGKLTWLEECHVITWGKSHNLSHKFRKTQSWLNRIYLRSDQISHSVMSDSLRPHESQHTRSPCPSPTPGVHTDSRPLSQWCHPAISSSVVPFSSCPQSLPASESFPMSQLFTWGGQSTRVSALASFPQRNPRADLLQNGLVGSLCSPRDSQESSPTPQLG